MRMILKVWGHRYPTNFPIFGKYLNQSEICEPLFQRSLTHIVKFPFQNGIKLELVKMEVKLISEKLIVKKMVINKNITIYFAFSFIIYLQFWQYFPLVFGGHRHWLFPTQCPPFWQTGSQIAVKLKQYQARTNKSFKFWKSLSSPLPEYISH